MTLLTSLDGLRKSDGLWVTTPAQLNLWWRQRENMVLKEQDGQWRIEGHGHERAHVAFFCLEGGSPHFEFQLQKDQR